MKRISGTPFNIYNEILGKATSNPYTLKDRNNKILIANKKYLLTKGFSLLIYPQSLINDSIIPKVFLEDEQFQELNEGDVLLIEKDGNINILWESYSDENALLVTEMCDCNCLMCPQPPKQHNPDLVNLNYNILNLLPKSIKKICLTGGEPTLIGDEFFKLIDTILQKFKDIFIVILSNGKQFSDIELTRQLAYRNPKNIQVCISLHADVDLLHDYITQSYLSFKKTQIGMYNLAKFGFLIELRIVVNNLNYTRLPQLAEYVYKNFPFVYHIAFMAQEMIGNAYKYSKLVWIDPYDYGSYLEQAVHTLHRKGMNVSIYNHQICILPKKIRSFARQSISTWKNIFLSICEFCSEKRRCCGFFSTSGEFISKHIYPID